MDKLQKSLSSLSISSAKNDRSTDNNKSTIGKSSATNSSLIHTESCHLSLQIKIDTKYSQYANRIFMNPYDMKRSKLSALDFLLLHGKYLFRCWPDLDCQKEQHAIICSTIEEPANDDFFVDCQIITQRQILSFPIAQKITLKIIKNNSLPSTLPLAYLEEYFYDFGVIFTGQICHVECIGKFSADFVILKINSNEINFFQTSPSVKVFITIIDEKSQFSLNDCNPSDSASSAEPFSLLQSDKIDFSQVEVGGLDEQFKQIVEFITLPYRFPEIFSSPTSLLTPPKGILLFGPPGTGKTLLAKKIAAMLKLSFFPVDASDIIGKYYGESEEKLIKVFQDAREASPSIIFIDELDALCPKREDSISSIEKRLVACLLTLMDGIYSKDTSTAASTFVIGATNRPHALDPALRRPGRFDREVEIPIPTAQQRFDILKKLFHMSNLHSLSTVNEHDLEIVANAAHGYVGADLAAVVREAMLHSVKNVSAAANGLLDGEYNSVAKQTISENSIENTLDNSVDELHPRFLLTKEDLLYGLTIVKPSAMREISIQIPSVRWNDIGGQHETKQRLQECVEWPLKHPEAFKRLGITAPKGVLLYGPPGCSKTLMAKALATEAKLNFIAVKGPELFNKWVGESEKAIKEIFRKARAASPSIVFFDEIDAIGSSRDSASASAGGNGENTVQDRVLSMLLNEMDGIEPLINVTIVGATNRPDVMDAALLRPGRFDRLVYVALPDAEARNEILHIQRKKMPFSPTIQIDSLVCALEGYSGAEIVAVCQEAGIHALHRDIKTHEVSQVDFDYALRNVRKGISQEMVQFYESFSSS